MEDLRALQCVAQQQVQLESSSGSHRPGTMHRGIVQERQPADAQSETGGLGQNLTGREGPPATHHSSYGGYLRLHGRCSS